MAEAKTNTQSTLKIPRCRIFFSSAIVFCKPKYSMIFWGQDEWGIRSPLGLETGLKGASYPYKYRSALIPRRNLALAWCLENLPDKAQVELESRLTGPRVYLLGCILAPGHTISEIPILEDARRVH